MRRCALLLLILAACVRADDEIEHLVPEMASGALHVSEGERPYLHRLAFTPAFGSLGGDAYYSVRLAYAPNRWLAYEAQLGHNPAESVHALVNTVNALLRWPLPGRLQPLASVGYGMMMIFPGAVFKADSVTKNVLSAGAGLEFFLRDDLALRGEVRGITLLGGSDPAQADGGYHYRELSVGLSFYRSLER